MAVVVLAVSAGAVMTVTRGESRGLALTRDRVRADLVLEEMAEAFAGLPRHWFEEVQSFPATEAAFGALHRALLEEHPLLARSPLREGMARQGLRRAVLLEAAAATGPARVRYVVAWTDATGTARRVETVRVVE